jgi:hypothetical protein
MWRNATYCYWNSTHPILPYTHVAEEMEVQIRVLGDDYDGYLFNCTILTETLYPDVDILTRVSAGSRVFMNNFTNTLALNATDPSGLQSASFYGMYEPTREDTEGLYYLGTVENITNGVPFDFDFSIPLILGFAQLSNQMDRDVIGMDVMIVVEDKTGITAHPSILVVYDLRELPTTTTTSTIPGTIPLDPEDPFSTVGLLLGVGVLGTAPVIGIRLRKNNIRILQKEEQLEVALNYLDQIQDDTDEAAQ